jgi:hypothetical protein
MRRVGFDQTVWTGGEMLCLRQRGHSGRYVCGFERLFEAAVLAYVTLLSESFYTEEKY